MNVRESHNYLTQLEQDLAAEADPNTRAWYQMESELQPEYILAKKTMAELGSVAELIGRLAHLNTSQAESSAEANDEEPLVIEQPRILTPEEIVQKRIERKYRTEYDAYQAEINAITATKKSRREFQEKIARRNFARRFNDFSELTGDLNIVMRADLLKLAATEICDDQILIDEIFNEAASYAKKYGAGVATDPKNFANIIASTVDGRPHSDKFENVLKGIFTTNPSDFPAIHNSLALASFELLSDMPALYEIVDISSLSKPYTTTEFMSEVLKDGADQISKGNVKDFLGSIQINNIFSILNVDITGLNYNVHRKQLDAVARAGFTPETKHQLLENQTEKNRELVQLLMNLDEGGVLNFDPVEIAEIGGGQVNLGLKPMPENLRAELEKTDLFIKRMQHLAPYSYAVRAAKKIVGNNGIHGLSIPLSPSTTIEVYIPLDTNNSLSEDKLRRVAERVGELYNQILSTAVRGSELGLGAYAPGKSLKMIYHKLYDYDSQGVIIYRPAVPFDKQTHSALQQLAINYASTRGVETLKGNTDFANIEHQTQWLAENEGLRQAIKYEQRRFLGRRPIKFSMPVDLRQMTGLTSISLRYDPKRADVNCTIKLDDGDVNLSLDRELRIDKTDGKTSLVDPGLPLYYENLILKLAKKWACSQEVRTSEGTISESTGNAANMGHYAYLPIRQKDSYKFRFREPQRMACLEEQGRDLAQESDRLKWLDPTGQERNSTYVRENYDPDKPPLEVYYSDLD